MIIMALVGEGNDTGDDIYFALTRELGPSRVRRVFVGFLTCPAERIRRLKIEAGARGSDDNVTLVVGINTAAEVEALRAMGAFICHTHRFSRTVPIRAGDLQVSESRHRPDHQLDAIEAYSECWTRRVAARRARREGAA